jgi:hypothetical protein
MRCWPVRVQCVQRAHARVPVCSCSCACVLVNVSNTPSVAPEPSTAGVTGDFPVALVLDTVMRGMTHFPSHIWLQLHACGILSGLSENYGTRP